MASDKHNETALAIQKRLQGLAIEPQVLVNIQQSGGTAATVTGDVTGAARVQLNPKGDRLLEVVAVARRHRDVDASLSQQAGLREREGRLNRQGDRLGAAARRARRLRAPTPRPWRAFFSSWTPIYPERTRRIRWARPDSNREPRDYESPALTIELQARAVRTNRMRGKDSNGILFFGCRPLPCVES